MALDGGVLALSIVGIVTAGLVTVATLVAIYQCAKVSVQVHLQKAIISNGGNNPWDASISSIQTPRPSAAAVDDVEMQQGTMSFFIEGVQNERPVRFSSKQLRAFTQGFAHKVGSGGFGVVYKGRFPNNGAAVAVKVLNSTLGRRAEEQFMAEVGTMGRTCHINLVRLYGFCFDASVKALVYEYMEKGSLDRHLFGAGAGAGVIGFEKLHEIAVGTAKAVRYLHEECARRIIHYDIKPENVLLGAGMAPKVSDFGLAKLCDREEEEDTSRARAPQHMTVVTGARGTPGYAAPELWMPVPVTHKCDVYSYGMLLFEMLGRRRNMDLEQRRGRESQEWYPRWVWRRFEAGETDAVLARAVQAAGDVQKAARMCKVALWCVQYRPEDRPTMGNVVRMLEGEEQIAAPGNPFAHLAAAYSAGDTDTNTGSYGPSGFTGR